MQTVKEYLSTSSAKIKQLLSTSKSLSSIQVHLTLGNVSCDVDSFVSSVSFSWMKTQLAKNDNNLYLPALSINKDDLELRTDIMHLADQLQFTNLTHSLVFLEDLESLSTKHQVFVTLVDHHEIDKALSFMESKIVEVVDHRPQARTYPPHVAFTNCIVASCSTLISETICKNITGSTLPKDLVHMLLCAILLDSGNLDGNLGKTTDRDVAAVKVLSSAAQLNNDQLSDMFLKYNRARFDVASLSVVQLMRKDAKFVNFDSGEKTMLMSSIHLGYDEFMRRSGLFDDVRAYASCKRYHVFVGILPVVKTGEVYVMKPILVHTTQQDLLLQLTRHLEADKSLKVSPESFELLPSDFSLLRMENIKCSRKQVLPVVSQFLQNFTF